MAWHRTSDKPLSEPIRFSYKTRIHIILEPYITPGPPTPDQNVYHACTHAWKIPLFADSGREKHPFFKPNRWFWGPIKYPFLKQNAILFSLYKIKYPFCESEINSSTFFLCTSYFSLCLIWKEYLNTRPRSNVWKPGWKHVDTYKMFTLFKISPIYAWKITPFSWVREFAPTFEKLPLSSRKWYERRYDREWGAGILPIYITAYITYITHWSNIYVARVTYITYATPAGSSWWN